MIDEARHAELIAQLRARLEELGRPAIRAELLLNMLLCYPGYVWIVLRRPGDEREQIAAQQTPAYLLAVFLK